MKMKWHIGALLLLLAFFGALQEQVTIPNQEIVLEFVDTQINKNDISYTISDVKEKLLKLGVSNINIEESESNTLKISYHSLLQVDEIKNVLQANQIVLNEDSEDKKNNTSSDYNIDIYDINKGLELSSTKDNCVIEIKSISDRFTTNHHYASIKSFRANKANLAYYIDFKFYEKNPFVKDHTSHQEPEVRAGPKYFFTS